MSGVTPDGIRAIVELGRGETIKSADGREFFTRQLHSMEPPRQASVKVGTLQGVVDYINALKPKGTIVVVDYNDVTVFSEVDPIWKKRDLYVEADAQGCAFEFGRQYEIEEFIIALQCNFVDTEEKAAILKFISRINSNDVVTAEDNGIAQRTVTKNEIGMNKSTEFPPVQHLRPYRTFRDVQQPEGMFLLRLRRGRGELPTVALYGADGDAWRLEAAESVYEFMRDRLPEGIPIIR